MNKLLILAVGIIVIVSGLYLYLDRTSPQEKAAISNNQSYTWSFSSEGEDQSGAPRTKVVMRTSDDREIDLGVHQGSCAEIKGSSWQLVTGEIDGVICWWAGGGTEIGVFEENGRRVVKVGQLDEGSAEMPGVRGNFKTLISL